MKRALLILTAIIGTVIPTLAQVTSISVEPFYTDDGTIAGYPVGHTTYRVYANVTHPTDRVTIVSGDDISPLVINVSGSGVWNHPNGSKFGDGVLCSLYGLIPLLEYDSYLTVGYSCDNDGSAVGVYGLDNINWQTGMFQTAPYGSNSVVVNSVVGTAWFVLTDNVNSLPISGNKVLLAQITTDGGICGVMNLQVFPEWAGAGSDYVLQTGLEFGTGDCGTPGCTDAVALNYDDAAGFDNGLCIYDCDLALDAVTVTPPNCFDDANGSIAFAGTGNQSYIQYTFNGDDLGLDENGVLQTGLSNGSYTLTIHDTRFDNENLNPGNIYGTCTVTQTVDLNTPELSITSSTATDVTCAGAANGCVNTNIDNYGGGTGDLSFMIYNGNTPVQDGSGNDLVLPTPDYCGLGGGTFHFVAMDGNGCTANGQNFTIVNPSQLTLFEGAEQPALCFNSTDATQVITWGGGTGDVDFSFVEGGPYNVEGNPANLIITDLTPGAHTVYATDVNNCTASLTYNVAGGPVIVITPAVVAPLCNGDANGSISIMAGGGDGNFTYSFDCVNFSATADMTDLAAGTYTVCVKDGNDCIGSQDVSVVAPAVLTATATSENIACNGETNGSITINANGGNDLYSYSLTGVEGSYTPSPLFENLSAGVYSIFVSDANGCTFELGDAATIVEPAVLTATALATDVLCNGDCNGTVVITANGGTAPFSYSLNGGNAVTSNSFNNLCPGNYTTVVTDDSGCDVSVSSVTVDDQAELVINNLTANPINSDPGGNNPYTVTGGVGTLDYSWTNGAGTVVSTSQNLPPLTGATDNGTYTVTITDDNGCTVTGTITVTGVGEFGENYAITLYPNPNNGSFVINMVGFKGEKMNYAVVDAAGRVVFAKELGNVNGTRIENIDMQDASAGIYNIQFAIGTEMHSMRFVKN